MSRTVYPTDSDVSTFVTGLGITLPTGFVTTGYAQMAVDEWERMTGYIPFLDTSGADDTRLYYPPGPNTRTIYGWRLMGGGMIMDLRAGLYALTSVTVGIANGAPGTVFVQGLDFWLDPADAVNRKEPFERIRFRVPQFGPEQSIQVVGRFGWGASIPEEAWQAIMRLGASYALEAIAEGLKANPSMFKEDDVTESYSPDQFNKLGASLKSYALTKRLTFTRDDM